jgi:cysteine desulfurase
VSVYLDCNATSPLEPRVREVVLRYLDEDFGNAGSRTHEFGARAKQAVERARDQVAGLVNAKRDEVVFTSGATESDNVALLGIAEFGKAKGRTHIISTAIEHKAVLEPLDVLRGHGFDVEHLPVGSGGHVDPAELRRRLRPQTLLVSVMHVNNETGILQPIAEVSAALAGHPAYFHVDAAQGFGKDLVRLREQRIDLISISGHKLYAPKGIGALITRRRGYDRVPLRPLFFGGGQERGLRPGTVPVHLVAGLGAAAEFAAAEGAAWTERCRSFRSRMLAALAPLDPAQNGDPERCMPNSISICLPRIDAEAAMVALKDLVAISNGSACTSSEYKPSHVLAAMGLSEDRIRSSVRISWCHMTPDPDWDSVVAVLTRLRRAG